MICAGRFIGGGGYATLYAIFATCHFPSTHNRLGDFSQSAPVEQSTHKKDWKG
jgi:hypothetical protein